MAFELRILILFPNFNVKELLKKFEAKNSNQSNQAIVN